MNIFDFLLCGMTGIAGDEGGGEGSGGTGEGSGASGDGNLPVMPQWAANLPTDITGTDANRNILMQHKDGEAKIEVPVNLVKSYVDARRNISGMVTVPGENATPEQINAFNRNTGVPDSDDGYDFKVPDKAPDGLFQASELKAFGKDAREIGVPKKKAEELFTRFADRQVETYNTVMSGNQETLQERIDGLKTDLGVNYDATVQGADKAANWADPGMVEVFEKANLLGHPVIVKGFAKLANALGEGMLKGVDTGVPTTTVTKEEVEGWMHDPKYKLPQSDPVGTAWRAKVEAGFKQLYPGGTGGDITPSSGRALHSA